MLHDRGGLGDRQHHESYVQLMKRALNWAARVGAIALLLGATTTSRQSLLTLPTYEFDFQTAGETPQRGKSATASFTRATTGSYINVATHDYDDVASGSVQFPSVNDFYDGTTFVLPVSTNNARGVLLSQSTVFQLLRNTALDNAAWTATDGGGAGVVTADVVPDPFGDTTMDNIKDDQAGTAEEVHQAVTIADDSSSWTVSGWATCVSSHTVNLRLALSGGSAPSCTASFTCNSTLKKAFCTVANDTSGNTTATVTLYGATSSAATTGDALWGYAQLVNAPRVPLREENTAAAAVTSNEDDLSYSAVTLTDTGSICGWFYPHLRLATSDNNALFSWGIAGTDSFDFYATETGTLALDTGGLADDMLTVSSTTISDYTWTHLCVTWSQSATSVRIYKNAVEVAYGDAVDSWSAAGDYGTTLVIGGNSAGRVDGDHIIGFFQYWSGKQIGPSQVKQAYNHTKSRGGY